MSRNRISKTPAKPLNILRLLLTIGETSGPYNEFSVAMADEQNVTLCTYFKTGMTVPEEITLFEGDDTLIGFFRALAAALDNMRYDIIHAHGPHLGSFFLLATVFRSRNLWPSTVYTVHSSYPRYKLRNKLLLIPVLAFFARVVCCGESSFESFPRLLRLLVGGRLHAVQNGVNIDRINRIAKPLHQPPPKRPFTVASVGRLIELKRPMNVLYAFQQIGNRGSRLVFIGEGHLRAELTAEIEKLGLMNQVRMTGLIPRDEVYAHLRQADLYISASRIEGLPLAVLEAMACGCPVILSDIPSHREITNGADFIPLVKLNDVDGYANEIRRFQSMSSTERSMIGSRCRRIVEDRFGLRSMHKGYEKVYMQLIEENHRYTC